jgi:hypothetical protein|tara:strand:+ start:1931 stop:2125 length:195 start_codon:yes stop_codon:yes gene_type:complete
MIINSRQKDIRYWNNERYRADCHGLWEEAEYQAELLAAVDEKAHRDNLIWGNERKSYIELPFEG